MTANSFYNVSGSPATSSAGSSAVMRAEFLAIQTGFGLFPTLTGNANKALIINSGGTAVTTTTGSLALAGDFATTGAYSVTLAAGAAVTLTLPVVSGTLATLAGTETLSNKTLVAPALGTPASGVLTNCTGTASGLTAGTVTTNANLTGVITSVGNTTSIASQTGTGTKFVMDTGPTITTLTVSSGGAAITGNTSVSGGSFTASPSNANVVLSPTGTGVVTINPATAGTINNVVIGGSTPLAGTFTTVADSIGNVRSIQQSGSDKTGSYSLATTDVGTYVGVGAGGSITVPNSTFATGNVITVFNNTSSTKTITISLTRCDIAGTDAHKSSLTLAAKGMATFLFITSTQAVVSGNVT